MSIRNGVAGLRKISLVATVVLSLGGMATVSAQDAPPAQDSMEVVESAPTAAPSQATGTGLPQRTPPPRTLHDFWPVFAGFTAAWILLIFYVVALNGRIDRLASRVPPSGADR